MGCRFTASRNQVHIRSDRVICNIVHLWRAYLTDGMMATLAITWSTLVLYRSGVVFLNIRRRSLDISFASN
jgi:hypothetical protein